MASRARTSGRSGSQQGTEMASRGPGTRPARGPAGQGTVLSSPWGNVSMAGYKKRKHHGVKLTGSDSSGGGAVAGTQVLHVPDLSLVDNSQWHKDLARAHYIVIVEGKNKAWLQTEFMPRIALAGLRAIAYWDSMHKNIIVKLFAPLDRLLYEADRVDKRLLLDSKMLQYADIRVNADLQRQGLQFDPSTTAHLPEEELAIPDEELYRGSGKYPPYEHIYAPFRVGTSPKERRIMKLFKKDAHTGTYLSNKDAIQLLINIIHAPAGEGGAGWDLERLAISKDARVLKHFPGHFPELKEDLRKKWYVWCSWPWSTPTNDIRMYLGEEVGMYFSFVSFLTMALLFPSIVGLATFIGQQITFTLHLIWLPGIAIAAAVWSTLWGEFWKRQQSTNAMEWGMTQFEDEETLRAAFMNSTAVLHRRSLVHGKPEYYSSPLAQRLKSSFSISLISIAIGTVVAVVVGLFFTRILLTNEEEAGNIPAGYGGILSSAIAAVQIQITSFLYKKMAVWLNDFENHATETQYRDSLILKSAIFETVNSYFSLFWIILKASGTLTVLGERQVCLEWKGKPDCLHELQQTIMVIFIMRLVVGNFQEIVLPSLIRGAKRCLAVTCAKKSNGVTEDGHVIGTPSSAELDAEKDVPDVFEDYMEILITYGYCALFVVAFPLAPLLAMVSFYVELRVDALKFLDGSTRTIPRGAQDIGTWQLMFEAFGVLSVLSNLVLVIFTESTFLGFTTTMDRVVALFFIEHGLFLAKAIIAEVIEDVTEPVQLQIKRQDYLVDKHIEGVEDEVTSVAALQAMDAENAGVMDGRVRSGTDADADDALRRAGAVQNFSEREGDEAEAGSPIEQAALRAAIQRSWVRQMLYGWKVSNNEAEMVSSLPVWGAFGPEHQDLTALEREAREAGEFVPQGFTGAGADGVGERGDIPEEESQEPKSGGAAVLSSGKPSTPPSERARLSGQGEAKAAGRGYGATATRPPVAPSSRRGSGDPNPLVPRGVQSGNHGSSAAIGGGGFFATAAFADRADSDSD